ncbi:MAG: hypothetical protein ISR91_05590 [Candidatus Delongbacteria bacterium]|nr:hypothetical protein [Candidatus Delongbacteria bacterium]
MYWENAKNRQKPAYLDLCLETIKRHSPSYEIVVLNEQSVFDYIPDLRQDIGKIRKIAHRADYIRARVIHQLGGIWLDSDIILLQEIEIAEYLNEVDFVGVSEEPGKPAIWFLGANPGNPIIGRWIQGMDRVLDERMGKLLVRIGLRKCRLHWTEIGYDILWPLMADYRYHNLNFEDFAPIRFNHWNQLLQPVGEPEDLISASTVSVMLYNKYMYEPLHNMSREEILQSPLLLGKLFRYSLGITAKSIPT